MISINTLVLPVGQMVFILLELVLVYGVIVGVDFLVGVRRLLPRDLLERA